MFSSDLVLIGHGNFVEFFLNIFLFSFFTYLFFLFLLFLFFFDWQRWATILKYFLSLWKYSFCCFWYCWYLCSIFSKYFFNLLFSFTTESLIFKTLFFLAQCSIFLCWTIVCLLFQLLIRILLNFFRCLLVEN